MGKLLNLFDKYILKFCVVFLIFFVALYPKLPSVHITHTWVYIRLEDFSIAATAAIWFIQLLRKKVRFPFALGSSVIAYWIFGFFSLVFSLIFIGPHLLNFFPSIAILSYLRRIEYMILFFVAFSSVRNLEDVKGYFKAIFLTTLIFTLYGFGQKFYIYFWSAFPSFFSKHPFCFPSFQTGNEEFAKGIPLCLPFDGRITSTFAGHYDLAAYLVMVIPIFIAFIFIIKRRLYRVLFSIFTLSTIIMLILTASRISFPAYLIGAAITLTLVKRKKFIIPLIILSIALLPLFSSSTFKRFLQTFRVASIVVDSSGNVVGEALSPEMQARIAKNNGIEGNIPSQNLPAGSGFIGLPQSNSQKTNTAVISSNLTPAQAKKLKLENGGIELTTIRGDFTLKKALVYDISVTTRLQAEWPNAINAFSKNIFLGSGFSTITLATDNDFLRFLGESGFLGLFSFLFIFLMLFILFRKSFWKLKDPFIKVFAAGLAGGIVGLFFNATLFDIFEASKVAETMWILLGVLAATLIISREDKIEWAREIKKVLSSHFFLVLYLLLFAFVFFASSISNFFVGDDFTWLRWAANFSPHDFITAFTNASGFFYRPIDKLVMFFLYAIFSFNPSGYHVFSLAVNFMTGVGVYFLSFLLTRNKLISFTTAFIFLLAPIHAENIFWISSISPNFSGLFIIYALLFFVIFRQRKSYFSYIFSLLFFILAIFSYEISLIFLGLIVLFDLYFYNLRSNLKNLTSYIPFALISVFYVILWRSSGALGMSGDYSYKVAHLVPNFIGNFIGYVSAFIFGESALPVYNLVRSNLRSEMLFAALVIGALMVLVLFLLYFYRKTIIKFVQNRQVKLFIFGILFTFVSLIPFLGLGNIAERYLFLASFGLALSFSLVIDAVSQKLSGLNPKLTKNAVFICILILLGLFYFREISHSNYEWQTAGKITNRTLSYLKIYDETIPRKSHLYFVNTPIRFEDAWVFSVGLTDGIWFIYRDESLDIRNVGSLEEARQLRGNDVKNKSYIFVFDKNLRVSETK